MEVVICFGSKLTKERQINFRLKLQIAEQNSSREGERRAFCVFKSAIVCYSLSRNMIENHESNWRMEYILLGSLSPVFWQL